jgi:FHA domain
MAALAIQYVGPRARSGFAAAAVALEPGCPLPPGSAWAVDASERWIGRYADCAIRVAAGVVARHHCAVALAPDGDAVLVRDPWSVNGTFVEGVRIASEVPVRLVLGATFSVAGVFDFCVVAAVTDTEDGADAVFRGSPVGNP